MNSKIHKGKGIFLGLGHILAQAPPPKLTPRQQPSHGRWASPRWPASSGTQECAPVRTLQACGSPWRGQRSCAGGPVGPRPVVQAPVVHGACAGQEERRRGSPSVGEWCQAAKGG
jgi:hypothetical protein